ncbi:MAG: hypothetical protein HYY02_04570 [Chloroflexi bacterium]|nr:hypothetical protein [Chloroflexota bacterium]
MPAQEPEAHGSPLGERPPAPARPAGGPAGDELADGIRIGRGPAPGFMRWLAYGVYLAGALYLLVYWPDTGYSPVVLVAALLLLAWVAYIWVGKRPPEP